MHVVHSLLLAEGEAGGEGSNKARMSAGGEAGGVSRNRASSSSGSSGAGVGAGVSRVDAGAGVVHSRSIGEECSD